MPEGPSFIILREQLEPFVGQRIAEGQFVRGQVAFAQSAHRGGA